MGKCCAAQWEEAHILHRGRCFQRIPPNTLCAYVCARVCWRGEGGEVCTAAGAAAAAAFDGVFVSKDKCEPLNRQAGGWGRTSGDREELQTHCVTTGINSIIRRKRVPITNRVFSKRHVYFMIMKSSY